MIERMDTAVSPLAKKLKLTAGGRAAVIGAPPGYLDLLDPPADIPIATSLTEPTTGSRSSF